MAVIPGSSSPVPDGGNTSDLGGVSWMQDVTEGSVRQNAYNQVFPSMRGAKESLLGNLLGGFFGVMTGIFTGVSSIIPSWFPQSAADYANAIRDGQLDLSDRADLLAPLLNYGSVFCPVSGANGRAVTGWGPVPFTEMIGYRRNVELASGGGLKLGEKGTWNYYLHMTSGFLSYGYGGSADGWSVPYLELIVLRPDGSEFSRETVAASINFKTSSAVIGGGASWHQTSNVLSGTVQVPDPDYVVKVEIRGGNNRLPWLGGPRWSRLTMQNISSDFFEDSATGGEVSSSENIQG